jgi:nucleoid DNA-binding protein
MKQIVITQHGDIDVLKVQEKSDPTPSSGEVLIKVKAIGINFADILARKGLYPDAPNPPCVVGYEVSGVIESVGQGVDSSKIGDPVLALTRFNGYSDKVCVSEKAVFPIPESLDFEKAAVIPVNYLTAYQLVHVMGGLKKGESADNHQPNQDRGGPMTKAELIEKIAKDADIPKTTAKAAFDSALDGIKEGLKKRNSKVTLVGFGTFRNVYRKTRMGRNPQTGEKIKIKGEKRGNVQAE